MYNTTCIIYLFLSMFISCFCYTSIRCGEHRLKFVWLSMVLLSTMQRYFPSQPCFLNLKNRPALAKIVQHLQKSSSICKNRPAFAKNDEQRRTINRRDICDRSEFNQIFNLKQLFSYFSIIVIKCTIYKSKNALNLSLKWLLERNSIYT